MNIVYYVNEKQRRVYACGKSREGYAEGIEPAIADILAERNIVPRKKMEVPSFTRCSATAHPSDDFDVEAGKAIARDRVLSKHYKRVEAALDAYRKGLDKLAEEAADKCAFCNDKVKNAKNRLDQKAC